MTKIRKICLVDDSAGMRKMGARFLEDSGYEVAVAVDGFHALRTIRHMEPDACFIDKEMPNINGTELVRILRGYPNTAGIKIAILSSSSSPIDKAAGFLAGADLYLTKPFTKDLLLSAIEEMEGLDD